jgi:predicted molibdopterin-dependent oxidoreductase YjgC
VEVTVDQPDPETPIPDRLPGFQHVEYDEARAKFDRAWAADVLSG